MNAKYEAPTTDDAEWADAVVFGTPTRFGMASAELKAWIDGLGGLWYQGKLNGKAGAVFSSTGSAHGGNEATILSLVGAAGPPRLRDRAHRLRRPHHVPRRHPLRRHQRLRPGPQAADRRRSGGRDLPGTPGGGSGRQAARMTAAAPEANTLIVAGATGYGLWPANTLEGLLRCLDAPVDGVEIDVQLTADGQVVAHHDYRLAAAATRLDGEWLSSRGPLLKSLSLADLRRYDVGRLQAWVRGGAPPSWTSRRSTAPASRPSMRSWTRCKARRRPRRLALRRDQDGSPGPGGLARSRAASPRRC